MDDYVGVKGEKKCKFVPFAICINIIAYNQI